jgi:S-methylmethionine-dependent homocysteine/selenocysteine methylase
MGDMAREYTHEAERGPAALARRLSAGTFVLDGATGTELERRGLACTLPLWSTQALLEAPSVLEAVHRDYAQAGVDCLTAATFRTQRHLLRRAGLGERSGRLSELALALARTAAASSHRSLWVAGSAPPLEDCYRPDLVPDDSTLEREHAQHCEALAAGGAELILVETQGTLREARAATAAAAGTGLPVVVSFIGGERDDAILSGEPLEAAIEAIAPFAPTAIAINCIPMSRVERWWRVLEASGFAFGVYPNLGAPGATPQHPYTEECTPTAFAEAVLHWVAAGASLVGGCCGTRPDHLRAACGALQPY